MGRQADVLDIVERNVKPCIEALNQRLEDPDENSALFQIRVTLESAISRVEILREYRKLRSKAIFLWDSVNDEFKEATKGQRMKIARNLLYERSSGLRG